jgi:hypothetical protein
VGAAERKAGLASGSNDARGGWVIEVVGPLAHIG